MAIQAALEAGSRPVYAVYIDRASRDRHGDLARLARTAEAAGVPVERVDAAVIASHASGQTHGGAIALCGPRRFVPLERLLPAEGRAPFIAMIDGVEDPFNFGQAARALRGGLRRAGAAPAQLAVGGGGGGAGLGGRVGVAAHGHRRDGDGGGGTFPGARAARGRRRRRRRPPPLRR